MLDLEAVDARLLTRLHWFQAAYLREQIEHNIIHLEGQGDDQQHLSIQIEVDRPKSNGLQLSQSTFT